MQKRKKNVDSIEKWYAITERVEENDKKPDSKKTTYTFAEDNVNICHS